VRAAGDDAVHEAELGLFDVSANADDWSDRTLFHLNADTVARLRLGGLELRRADGSWLLTDLGEGEEQNTDAVEDLVRMLTTIDFVGVLTADERPALSTEADPTEIEVELKSGETVRYRISRLEGEDDYLLEASNRPQRFRLAAYAAGELSGIDRSGLLKKAEPAEADAGAPDTGPQIPASLQDQPEPPAVTGGTGDSRLPQAGEVPYPIPSAGATGTPGDPGLQPERKAGE
jgi:hypothetical protein